MKRTDRRRQLHIGLDNRGSAIVTVIIAMAFVGILASVLMYMTLLNFQMKINNRKAKDNFYTAETVLDEIRLGMQEELSDALDVAYGEVLTNYASSTQSSKESMMRYYFLYNLQQKYAVKGDVSTYNPALLYSYIDKSLWPGTVMETTYTVSTSAGDITYTYQVSAYCVNPDDNLDDKQYVVIGGNENMKKENWQKMIIMKAKDTYEVVSTAYDDLPSEAPKGTLELYEDSVSLKSLRITYTDDEGYVSVIETDLRVNVPSVEFATSVTLPTLGNTSLVAGETLQVLPEQTNYSSNNTISGSFYAKDLIVGSKTAGEGTGVTLNLKETGSSADENKRMVIEEELYVGAGAKLTSDENGELWAGSITMNGKSGGNISSVRFLGNDVYVAGNLLMTGDGNVFEAGEVIDGLYQGKYIGFGDGTETNSAIVVNGTNSQLLLSELQNLTLAGRAYIAVSDYEKGQREDEEKKAAETPTPTATPAAQTYTPGPAVTAYPSVINSDENSADKAMGQSIAVKSDQLAYLVPASLIGISTTTGESVIGSNPMTKEQYDTYIIDNQDVPVPVREDLACAELGGKKLNEYYYGKSDTFTTKPYYQRVSSDIVLVYYFVVFNTSTEYGKQAANEYFRDYYNANQDTLDAYASIYAKAIQLRGGSESSYIMHLAGNVVERDASGTTLRSDTLAADSSNSDYLVSLSSSKEKFDTLCHKLLDNATELSTAEQHSDIYSNLVYAQYVKDYTNRATSDGTSLLFEPSVTSADNYKAVVIDGDYTYDDTWSGLIICNGNVTLKKSFQGTILASGNITLEQDVSVVPNQTAVQTVLTYSNVARTTWHVYDFLKGGEGYLSSNRTGVLDVEIDLGDLITYENWSKE